MSSPQRAMMFLIGTTKDQSSPTKTVLTVNAEDCELLRCASASASKNCEPPGNIQKAHQRSRDISKRGGLQQPSRMTLVGLLQNISLFEHWQCPIKAGIQFRRQVTR